MHRRPAPLMATFSLALAAFLQAQSLSFTEKNKTVQVKKGENTVLVDYAFTNNSEETVAIRKFDAPCTCLSAKVLDASGNVLTESMSFPAGSSGTVQAKLELGKFKGNVNKKILVWTDSDKDSSPSTILNMEVKVPYLIAAYPRSVSWKRGEDPTPKDFTIKVTDSEPIKIVSHKISNPAMEYSVETVKEGFEYKVTVTPKDTKKTVFSAIHFNTDSKEPRYQKVQSFVSVKP